MENWTSVLIGISTSFIASILFFFSSDFIKRKGNQFIEWVASKSENYSNKIYTNLAQDKSSFVEMFPAFALLFILFTFFSITSITFNDKYEIHIQVIEGLKNNPNINAEALYELEEKYRKQQVLEGRKFIHENFWIYTTLKYFLISFSFIATVYISLSIIRWSRIKEQNSDFRRMLEIISPYLEKDKINTLRSKWGRMKSEKDYDEIYNEIQGHLEKIEHTEKEKPTPNNA